MEINSLLESANGYKSLQADASRLADKWAASGLLEGLNAKDATNMSMMLENQAKQIVAEQSSTSAGSAFAGGAGEQWAGVALPLVRKVFAQISAKDFVSVQPMNLPSGLVFFLDFKYGSAVNGRATTDSLYGKAGNGFAGNEAQDGLYGAGQFGYSVKPVSTADTHAIASSEAATAADVNFSGKEAGKDLIVMDLPASADKEGVRAFQTSLAGLLPEFTKIDANGKLNMIVDTTDATVNTLTYHVQPAANSRGDFEDSTAPGAGEVSSLAIPEINVDMKSESVVAKTRKLKAQWTPEFSQDLNAYHSIDAEAELTSLLSEYISMEIDLEILDMLISGADTTEYWSANNNKVWNGSAFVTDSSDFYNTQGQWFQTLGTKIQKVSNKIHQRTLRGGANFLVCSPSVATILESIPGFAANTDGDSAEFAFGVQKVGQLNGRFKVYKNPYMTENVILTGFRGGQFLEAGAVYAPYVPLIMTPLVYDPVSFTPRKGIMTRYAKKMIRPEFYGKIYVADLATV